MTCASSGLQRDTDLESWLRLLVNTGLMAEDRTRSMPSAGGLLLFGLKPNRCLPQAGISAVAYSGRKKDYDAKARATLRGPAVSLFAASSDDPGQPLYPLLPRTFSEAGSAVEAGVIEQALDFVRRNIEVTAWIEKGGRRVERWDYPLEAVREALVNAVAHRDYTIAVTDIELSIYTDRIEIISPGRLPNTVTVDRMRAGCRASRNELIKEVLRDYRYIEATGRGVPRRIIGGMRAHNATEPDLIEEDDRFPGTPVERSKIVTWAHRLESHEASIKRLFNETGSREHGLFLTEQELLEQAYDAQEKRTAYVDEERAREAPEAGE